MGVAKSRDKRKFGSGREKGKRNIITFWRWGKGTIACLLARQKINKLGEAAGAVVEEGKNPISAQPGLK